MQVKEMFFYRSEMCFVNAIKLKVIVGVFFYLIFYFNSIQFFSFLLIIKIFHVVSSINKCIILKINKTLFKMVLGAVQHVTLQVITQISCRLPACFSLLVNLYCTQICTYFICVATVSGLKCLTIFNPFCVYTCALSL